MKKNLILIIAWLVLISNAHAQYIGGKGNGDGVGRNLIDSYNFLYGGGAGRGDAVAGKSGLLVGCNSTINPGGATVFCNGGYVTLTGSSGSSYLWSNGDTTASIDVTASGNYNVEVTDSAGCTSISVVVTVTVDSCTALDLRVFIEGFYSANGIMNPVLYSSGLSTDPDACDSITVELHSANSPYDLLYSVKNIIDLHGNGRFVFPGIVRGSSFYIVVRLRNAVETWSKNAFLFNSSTVSFDFTSP